MQLTTRGTQRQVDGLDLLAGDHRRIDALFDRILVGGVPGPGIWREVVRLLSIHGSIEKEHLAPFVRQNLPDGHELAREGLAEHGQVEGLLVVTEHLRRGTEDHMDAVFEVIELVRRHNADEEARLFPALRRHVPPSTLRELGGRLEAARRHAPTRPHPLAPDSAVAARLLDRLVAPADRLRDRLSDRLSDRLGDLRGS